MFDPAVNTAALGSSAVGQAYCARGMGKGRGHKDGFIINVSLQQRVHVVSITLLSALATDGIKIFSD